MSGLHPTLRPVSRNIPRVARSLGFQARVTSGYRSTKKQAALYDKYIRGLHPYPVAPPGTSDHEFGIALDVVSTDTSKLVAMLATVGLSWAGPGDPVHFVLTGLKPQKKGISAASKSWEFGPGATIPAIATQLPIVGKALSVLKDPWGTAKFEANKFLDALLGLL